MHWLKGNKMIDLDRVCQLYATAHDESKTPEQRAKADKLLAEIDADTLIAEYLLQPQNLRDHDSSHAALRHRKGQPRFGTFADLARFVIGWLIWEPGESNDEYHAREDRLLNDRLGILVRHLKWGQARAMRTCDCQDTRIFGDKFHLGVHWCGHDSQVSLPI